MKNMHHQAGGRLLAPLLATVLALGPSLQAQTTVTTLGGGAAGNKSGDTFNVALFNNPAGIASDSVGQNLYVADKNNNEIRLVELAQSTTLALGYKAISKPVGVALDPNNDVFVLNAGTGKNGTVLEFGPIAQGGFFLETNAVAITNAGGIALDTTGDIFVTAGASVLKITPANVKTTVSTIGNSGATLQGIVYRRNGMLAVCDSGRNGIYNINPLTGVVTTNAGFNGKGDFITNSFNFDFVASAKFNAPLGITEAGDGTLLVADSGNGRCKVITTTGLVTNLYGITPKDWNSKTPPWVPGWEDGTVIIPDNLFPNVQAKLPNGICMAPDGTVYTTEDGFHLIRKATGTGLVAAPPVLPSTPLNLSATATFGQVTLNWSIATGATNYDIKRSSTSGSETIIATSPTNSYVDTTVLNGNTYFYEVSGINASGQSSNSDEVSVTVPLPAVSNPEIGYVTFPPPNFTSVFTPVSQSGSTFNNDVAIMIVGTPGTETHYTVGPTLIATNVADPDASSPSASSDYQDGLTSLTIGLTNITIMPQLTIKAIGTETNRPNSAIVTASFQFVAGNPNVAGNNAALFTINDITTGAELFYTTDGSDPSPTNTTAVDLGILPPTTNNWTVSLNIQSNTVFKVVAYKANYQPSAITTNIFSVTNFLPNAISFGFAAGEASSEFIASPGETFYAPVTLTLVPGTEMYSLQFALTVTNAGPNPGPPVLPNTYSFQSMLMQPQPVNTNFPAGVQLYESIPPFMLASSGLSSGFLPPSTATTNYNNQDFLISDVPDTNFNLLAVGWFERFAETNLYNTLSQDLIAFSQAHDDTFLQAGGKIIVGGYAFTIPTNAILGQTYQIQVGRASATSDGVGASAKSGSVFIAAPTTGSLSNGAINAVKVVTLGQAKYLVGDVYPFRWFNAGDFGAGDLVTNGSADAEQVFEAAAYDLNAPPKGSDFFDAMDSSGAIGVFDGDTGYYTNAGAITPTQENAIYGGDYTTMNQIAFGDGQLDISDVFVTFLRSENARLTWYSRFWTNGVLVADTSVANPPFISKALVSSPSATQSKVLPVSTVTPQVHFSAGDITNSTGGRTVSIPISANIYGIYPLRDLMLNLTVEPLDGSPALTSPVGFQPNVSLGQPASAFTDSHGLGNYAAAWLTTNSAGFTGTVTLGTLFVTLPSAATSQSAYAVHFDHASASPNGVLSFPKQTYTGLITLSSRTTSSYGDGIPDSWRLRWFGTTNNLLSVSNACPTGDGINNWQKFVAGVDPNAANDFPSVINKTPVPSGSTAAIHWPSVLGKNYVIMRANALFSGNWISISTNVGTGVDMEYDDSSSSQTKFYRVLIQQ